MIKKIISSFIIFFILFNFFIPIINNALNENETEIIEIYTSDDLWNFEKKYNNREFSSTGNLRVEIKNDIDLKCSSSKKWVPLGLMKDGTYIGFAGTFNGNNHTISNIYIQETETGTYIREGIFSIVEKSGIIKNVNFSNVEIENKKINRKIYGETYGIIAAELYGEIKNCSTTKCKINIREINNYLVSAGGMVGYGEGCSINNCLNGTSINISAESRTEIVNNITYGYYASCGGILAGGNNIKIYNSNNGAPIINKAGVTGGISGQISNGEIKYCNNLAEISAGTTKTTSMGGGGIAGEGKENITIYGCSNHANIKGINYNQQKNIGVYIGGILGKYDYSYGEKNAKIENCYNIGNVLLDSSYSSFGANNRTDFYNFVAVSLGELIGYLNVYTSTTLNLKNIYLIGEATQKGYYGSVIGCINGYPRSLSSINIYRTSSLTNLGNGPQYNGQIIVNATKKNESEMKEQSFVTMLNKDTKEFIFDSNKTNNGYPIISSGYRKPLVIDVKYSTKNITNQPVKVTIKANQELKGLSGWTLSSDKKILTKEYIKNTDEEITIEGVVGNELKQKIKITNIDKVEPVLNVKYSIEELTNKNVIATITSNENIQEVLGWKLSSDKKTLTKEYTKNTEEEVIVKDIAGNKSKQTISIKNIDKEGPEINLSIYSAIKPNSNLEININVTDELAGTNEDSIRYIWSKEKNLNKEDITNKIKNNKIIKTPENVIDTYYLYIYAKDKVGNETVYRSKEFNLDYTRNENIVFADKLVANSTEKNIMKNNRIYLQSLVDKVSEDGGGIVHIPSGTYYFSGNTDYYSNAAVGIVCKNNVTIEGEGIDKTVLKPYGEYLHGMNMFHYTDSNKAKTYLINADFRNFTVDSINETTKEYNYQGKGFMLAPIKDCDWESVKVINADGTGFGVDLPINCTMINCYAKGCGKAGTRSMSGSSGFGIGTGYSNEESILISDCKSFENTKYGFFFEHQSRFNSDLNNLEFNADASNGFIVISCVAKDNLYDYGGIRANDVVYENCVSLKPTKVLTDNEGNIYNNMGIHYEEYSKRVYAVNCKFEDPFTDVLDNTQSYYEPVYWAYNNGVVEKRIQDGKNVFRVNDIATRGVAATFLYKYMGRPGEVVKGRENKVKSEVLKTSFTDVKIDDYYYEPVEWLNSLKIINASGKDTEFKPTELCTRAMFITMLYRLAGNPEVTLANNFEDVGNQGKWYQNAVNWGISRGIIDDKDTKFYPDKGISRAEIVTFLYKYENSKNTTFNNKFYLTGGQLSKENKESYISGVDEITLNNPTKKGYKFIGWTGSDIVNDNILDIEPQKNVSITKESTGNKIYTANWKPIEYKINYIANNGTDESKIQNCTYNASQKIIKNDFAKKGYVFKEWNTKEDGTGKSYSEDKVVSNLSSQDRKTIKLYAQWEKEAVKATGDVTQDGVVNIGDLLKLKQHIAYEQSETTKTNHPNWKLDEEKVLIGDVNKNGKIDVGDILKLRRYIAASTSKEIAEKHSDWLNI